MPARAHDQPASGGQDVQSVIDGIRPFVIAVMKLQRMGNARGVDPAQADARLRKQLEQTRRHLLEHGLDDRDVDDSVLALIAFTDEKMQADAGPMATYWGAKSWGRSMLGHVRSGEEFYERLDQVRASRAREHVLAAYYICLRLGFHGVYLGESADKRDELLEALDAELTEPLQLQDVVLSPRAARPDDKAFDRKRNAWLQALVAAFVVFSCSVFFLLWAVVDMEARDLVSEAIQGRSAVDDHDQGLATDAARRGVAD